MLILTRKEREAIVINDGQITVRVLSIKSGKVRLGIDAPRDVSIHREEIYKEILQEQSASDGVEQLDLTFKDKS